MATMVTTHMVRIEGGTARARDFLSLCWRDRGQRCIVWHPLAKEVAQARW